MNKIAKIASIVGAGALLVGAGAFLGANAFPKEITKEVPTEVTVEKIVTVEKEVKVPVEVIKTVDNANLPTVLKFVEDNIDEDITMDYILFEVNAEMEAESHVRDNMLTMLKDNDYFEDGAVFDNFRTSEVSISKIYEAEIMDRDFEDKNLVLKYEVKMKAKESGEDAIYKNFEVTIPFEEGKLIVDDIELSEI